MIDLVLIVEDEPTFRRSLKRELMKHAAHVLTAATVADALWSLRKRPQLVMLDLSLPDGKGETVLVEALKLESPPDCIVVTGSSNTTDAFRLAGMGVYAYLGKPLDQEALHCALDRLKRKATRSPIKRLAAGVVGHVSVGHAVAEIREAMVAEAMRQTSGNKSAAARLLGMTRQGLQLYLRRIGMEQIDGMKS